MTGSFAVQGLDSNQLPASYFQKGFRENSEGEHNLNRLLKKFVSKAADAGSTGGVAFRLR